MRDVWSRRFPVVDSGWSVHCHYHYHGLMPLPGSTGLCSGGASTYRTNWVLDDAVLPSRASREVHRLSRRFFCFTTHESHEYYINSSCRGFSVLGHLITLRLTYALCFHSLSHLARVVNHSFCRPVRLSLIIAVYPHAEFVFVIVVKAWNVTGIQSNDLPSAAPI